MRSALPGMPSAVHAEICAKFESRFPLEDVSAAELALHLDLENELRKCGELTTAHSDVSQNPILSVWKRLSENLKRTWNSATDCKGEDTHVHHRLGPFVAPVFPGKDFEVIWANKQIEGSQARREDCGREGYRPDLVIKKKGLAFLISEVKPPEHDDNVDDYVADLWKLVILMKDQIDHELDGGAEKTFMFGLHVFGYKADLWVMDLELEGIYHLYHVGEACLPRYQRDTGGVRYVTQLFFSIKVCAYVQCKALSLLFPSLP
ncbi:hypothetical protein BC939DRAFT_461412 [Gamsiella multidivaricata]|uniref:uncharacterized protein n=1 Tax=Gamsiella multidivaricata TaxID=101098 RepID=UPI0022209109|nr:uncharacterized protein BC939DRAFT_461412 [Gamsiella multidivaricata]KAI7818910.1 hypothetical protein BC939DRAFT_461412 [Gamsiella multidivaricata]